MDELPGREDLREAWSALATGYDRDVTPSHFRLGRQGLERAGLRAGMRFLDVAAGTGALSIPAGRIGADVLATDLSPAMLETLEARARREGLAVETRVMDGHALALEDGTFDVAGSQFGVMLFEDAPTAIRELARVTRPGGRVLLTVFGDPAEVEFLQFFTAAIRAVRPAFPGLPTDPPPLPFQFRDPAVLASAMEAAGLTDVRVESTTETLEIESGRQLWRWLLNSNPIPGALLDDLGLDEEERAAAEEALVERVRKRAGGAEGPVHLTSPVHIGVGTR